MTCGQRDVERLPQQRHDVEARGIELRRVLVAVRHNDVVVRDQAGHLRRRHVDIADVDFQAVVPGDAGQQPRQQHQRGRLEDRDPHPPARRAAVGVQFGLGPLEGGEHLVGTGDQRAAGVGQPQSPARRFGERQADLALQRAQLLRNRRRRAVQRPRGRRHAPAVGELAQRAQATQIHATSVREAQLQGSCKYSR